MSSVDKLPILLVEDSDDDLFFFKRLFAKAGIKAPLQVVTDGQQAINHLTRALERSGADALPVPRLVFLDLKLPLRGGFEVLQWVRMQPRFSDMVVVVLSSSAEARDIVQAYELGAQGYLVKYPEPAVFLELVRHIAAMPPGAELKPLKLPGLEKP